MGAVARGAKTGGGTDFNAGQTALASEFNDDLNTLYTLVSGNLDAANLASGAVTNDKLAASSVTDTEVSAAASARIAATKIDDASTDAAANRQSLEPGTFADQTSPNPLPVDLEDEIQHLRGAIQRLAVGLAADTGTDAGTVGWYDPPGRGRNLIYNGGFSITDDRASGDAALPVGWTNSGSATLALTTDTGTGEGNVVQITDGGTGGDALTQVLDGLKASATYIVGCIADVGTGTFTLATTGAGGTELAVTSTSTSYTHVSGVFVTDATPANVTISLTATGASDVVRVRDVYCFECRNDIETPPSRHGYRISFTGENGQTMNTTAANITDGTDNMSVTVMPVPGCQIRAKAKVTFSTMTVSNANIALHLLEDGSVVDSSTCLMNTGADAAESVYVEHLNTAPTPGTALTYTIQGETGANEALVGANASAQTPVNSVSWLDVEVLFP